MSIEDGSPNQGDSIPEGYKVNKATGKIEWGADVDERHKRFVDAGLFDAVPTEEFVKGEKVIFRYTGKVVQIQDLQEDQVVGNFGKDKNGQPIIRTVNRDDLRSFGGYGRRIMPLMYPFVEVLEMDGKPHGKIVLKQSFPK